jgi:group I intron endonuclease
MKTPFLIYKVTSPSGKVYIGLTCQTLRARRSGHFRRAREVLPGTHYFCDAIRKYGDDLIWEVLERGEGEEWAAEREKFFIAQFESCGRSKGYNLTPGGEYVPEKGRSALSGPLPQETREKMSQSARERGVTDKQKQNLVLGRVSRPHSKATREKLRAANTGRTASPETRIRMSKAHAGKTHTQAHRNAKREAMASPVLRSDGRPFLSARQAAQEMGASQNDAVSRSIRRQTRCGGFTFKRITRDEYEEARAAWDRLLARGHVEQQPAWTKSRKGYTHSHKARRNMARSARPHTAAHRQNRLAAISKRVVRSDGVTYDSISAAAQEMGLTTSQMSYSIKKGTPRDGFTFSFA